MQVLSALNHTEFAQVGFGIRVLLLTSNGEDSAIKRALAKLGCQIDLADELYTALSDVLEDPRGYGLFVIDCDSRSVGGLEGGKRAVQILGEIIRRMPMILISRECRLQVFPEDRMAATELRAPLSSISLRIGFEHAMRELLAYRYASLNGQGEMLAVS